MKGKLFALILVLLCFIMLFPAGSSQTWGFSTASSQSWGLAHKMEFCLLVVAVIVLFCIRPVHTDPVPNEFKTLRFLVYYLVFLNFKTMCLEVTVIVDPT